MEVDKQIANIIKNHTKTVSKENKKFCGCAVKVAVKAKAHDLLEQDVKLYLLPKESKSSGKTLWECYKKCTRATYEDKDHCFKHNESSDNTDGTVMLWDDIINNKKSKVLTPDDKYFGKKSLPSIHNNSSGKTTNVISFVITEQMKKYIKEFMELEDDDNTTNNKSDNKPDASNESDNEEEVDASNELDNEEESGLQSDDDDDNKIITINTEDEDDIEVKIIETKSGRKLYLDDGDMVYSKEADEDKATFLGINMPVDDKDHTEIEIDGCYYIVAKSINHNGKSFLQCTLTNNVFFKNDDDIIKYKGLGKTSKNGEFKIVNPNNKPQKKKKN